MIELTKKTSHFIPNLLKESKNKELVELIIKGEGTYAVWEKLANSYFQSGNYSQALNCYMRLIALAPESPFAWNKLAVTFLKMGNLQSARSLSKLAFKLAEKRNPLTK
jgi:tetratricopeptide (TPR) repeat protein